MRRVTALLAFFATLALTAALAVPATADPPGFNGTIKIHDPNESEPMRANEPHPGCVFHIHGFNFDGGARGTWRIVAWPPTGDGSTVAASGTWGPADGSGNWRTADMSLESGHYKAFADQTDPKAPGGEKHKVFWVECGAAAPQSAASAPPSSAPASSAPASSAPASSAPESAAPSSSAPPSPQGAASTPSPTPTQLGFERGPMVGVTPIVESAVVPPATLAAPTVPGTTAVAGVEQAPVAPVEQQPAPITTLPSTSTQP